MTAAQKLHYYCLKYTAQKTPGALNIGSSLTIEQDLDTGCAESCISGI